MPTVLRPAGPGDEQLVAGLLADLSPASSFHRFMAGVGPPKPGLVRGLLRTEGARGALLALRPQAAGVRAVGHACWAVNAAGTADLGVVVADGAQGHGIGSRLFVAAAERAARAGATTVHLDVHPENRRLATALRRRLGAGSFAWQEGLLTVDAPLAVVVDRMRPGVVVAA